MENSGMEMGPGTMPLKESGSAWGWFIGLGVILIVLGFVAFIYPAAASVTLAKLLGWLFVIGGVAQGLHGIATHRWKGFFLNLLGGVILVLFGAVLVANPDVTLATFTLILGIYLVVGGIIKVISSIMLRSEPGWSWLLFGGLVDFILGALIWGNWPSTSAWVIGLLVGISLFFSGLSMLMIGIAARSLAREVA